MSWYEYYFHQDEIPSSNNVIMTPYPITMEIEGTPHKAETCKPAFGK